MLSTKPLQRLMGEQTPLTLLTHAEEIDLARRVAAGQVATRRLLRRGPPTRRRRALRRQQADGLAAREALVLHNLRLVLNIAGRFRNASLTYDDLVQEGIAGLLKAADRYDPKRGTRFATFAVWWIRQSISRAIANFGRSVRLPVNRVHKISQLRRYAARLEQMSSAEPAVDDLARALGVSPRSAAALMQDGQDVISLDTPLDTDDRDTLERIVDSTAADPESVVIDESLNEIVEELLLRLDGREAEILRMRFGIGGGEARPLRAIAAQWHMSPEGVRQIGERALSRLRSMPTVRGLSEFLR